jgi:hypothetical protein
VGVAICAKLLQFAPPHRSTRYPVMAALSVAADQLKFAAVPEVLSAVRFVGAVGPWRLASACISAAVRTPL